MLASAVGAWGHVSVAATCALSTLAGGDRCAAIVGCLLMVAALLLMLAAAMIVFRSGWAAQPFSGAA